MKMKFNIYITIIIAAMAVSASMLTGSTAEKESCVICHTDMKKLMKLTENSSPEEEAGCGAEAGEG